VDLPDPHAAIAAAVQIETKVAALERQRRDRPGVRP
jgi:hypothetical protein